MDDETQRVTLMVTVVMPKDRPAMALAEQLFDFLADDPDDLFPHIIEVEDFGAKVEA